MPFSDSRSSFAGLIAQRLSVRLASDRADDQEEESLRDWEDRMQQAKAETPIVKLVTYVTTD